MPPIPLTPETFITSIHVDVATASEFAAGTDDDVTICLFDLPNVAEPYTCELLGDFDQFENGSCDPYELPESYFKGRQVADINVVRLQKSADSVFGGWAFAGLTLKVNGIVMCQDVMGNCIKWLEDDDLTYTSPNLKRMPFVAPTFKAAQASIVRPGEAFKVAVAIDGGKPLQTTPAFRWSVPSSPAPGVTKLAIQWDPSSTRQAFVTGIGGPDNTTWSDTITVTDALNQVAKTTLTLKSMAKVPAPTITGLTPDYGWRSAPPAAAGASYITVNGNFFYSTPALPISATMTGPNGTQISAIIHSVDIASVAVVVPDGAVSGPITITTPSGSVSSPPVTIHASPYRFRWGFAFANRMDKGQDLDGFPSDFSWDRYEEAYGIPGMYIMVLGQPTLPDPWSAAFYAVTRGMISDGCCHGFSLQSLRMQQQVIGDLMLPTLNSAYPLAGTFFDKADGTKPADDLSHLIQVGQLAMLSSEAFVYYGLKFFSTQALGPSTTMDARPMLADVTDQLTKGWNDPRMIAFSKNLNPFNGHVVVPFAADADTGMVHCYNSNQPARTEFLSDEQLSSFNIDKSTGKWTFNMGSEQAPDLWQGVYCFSIPLSVYGHQYHWSILSPLGLAKALANYMGTCIGGPGTTVEAVGAGAQPIPTWVSRPVHAITAQTAQLRITSNDGPALCCFILNSGVALSIEEIHGVVTVDLDLQAGTVHLTEQHLASDIRPLIRVVRHDSTKTVSSTFAVRAAAGTSAGMVGLSLASDTPVVSSTCAQVDLHTRRLDSLANDLVTELAGVPNALLTGSVLRLGLDGTLALAAADGSIKDLSSVRPVMTAIPTHVSAGDQPATLALRRNGILPLVTPAAAPSATAQPPASTPYISPGAFAAGAFLRGEANTISPATAAAATHSLATGPGLVAATRAVLSPSVLAGLGNATSNPGMRAKTPPLSGLLPVDLGSQAQWLTVRGAATGPVQVRADHGTQVLSVVHERDGYRSFPRSVMVTVPSSTARARSACIVVAEQPGLAKAAAAATPAPGNPIVPTLASASVPLTLVAPGFSLTALTLVVSQAVRLSAVETQPNLRAAAQATGVPDLILAPQLAAQGAKVTRQIISSGKAVFSISLASSSPATGRLLLGSLQVPVLNQPGSVWSSDGLGSAHLQDGRDIDLNFVAVQVRLPGDLPIPVLGQLPGPLTGPIQRTGIQVSNSSFAEGDTVTLTLAGFPSRTSGVGWWVTSSGGHAQVIHPAGTTAQLKGLMAGPIRVHALAGQQVLTIDLLVGSCVGWSGANGAMLPKATISVDPHSISVNAGGNPFIRTFDGLLAPIWNPGDPAALLSNAVDLGVNGVVRVATAPVLRTGPAV